jgi:hypothetical protein
VAVAPLFLLPNALPYYALRGFEALTIGYAEIDSFT